MIRRIAMKFGMTTCFDPLKPSDGQKLIFNNHDGGQPMPGQVRGRHTQTGQNQYVADADGVYIGATWRIRLNRSCAAAMRPYVKLI